MSVQAGIWNFDGKPVDRKLIEDFSESLSPQGPDGQSHYVDGFGFAVSPGVFSCGLNGHRAVQAEPPHSAIGRLTLWVRTAENLRSVYGDRFPIEVPDSGLHAHTNSLD